MDEDIFVISGNPNDVEEFRGLFYKDKEIMKTMNVLINPEEGLIGWKCLLGDGFTKDIKVEYFKEELGINRIIVGVE